MTLQPVILSGGSGTRLWPASREQFPKQLLALVDAQTLLQSTAHRLDDLSGIDVAAPIVVTNEEYRFIIAEQLRQSGIQQARIMLEPIGRNTAPAMELAALMANADNNDPVLLVMPSDHVMRDTAAFCTAIREALTLAQAGALVTFGIVPERAETGYGYLRTGTHYNGAATARHLSAFVEKPDAARAAQYVASGEYLWNSGLFMMRASVWQRALAQLNPAMSQACAAAFAKARHDMDFVRVDREAFAACPSDSIDYAVMEKLAGAPVLGEPVVVPLAAGWSDVGAWDALWQIGDKDADGNVARGDVMLEQTQDSLVFAESRLVATLGLQDAVVVETADAVLVANKSRTQDIKALVTRLKAEGRTLTQSHRKVYRPWGWYDSVDAGERFQVKRIVVNPGARLSLQMHHHRAEHWIVVRGTAEVTCGDKTFLLSENESTFIPLGQTHRLGNPGRVPLEMIEVQSGAYLGEDDIVRFEDTYGRTP